MNGPLASLLALVPLLATPPAPPPSPAPAPPPPSCQLYLSGPAALVAPDVASTPYGEVRPALSPNGNLLLWGSTDRPFGPGGWEIWMSHRIDKGWSEPVAASFNSSANDFDPAFDPSGRWVYFFSNRKGGLGGDDIYRAPFDPDTETFGEAENLGPAINSKGDEWAPTPLSGRRLLFASDGRGGRGRHDLFVATEKAEGGWGEAKGLPGSVNSPADEFDATLLAGEEVLVFSRSEDAHEKTISLYAACRGPEGYTGAYELPQSVNVAEGWTLGPALDPTDPQAFFFTSHHADAKRGKLDLYRIRFATSAPPAPVASPAPEVFAPGTISGPQHETAPAFTPDDQTVFFSRTDGGPSTILVSRRENGVWTEPQVAPFSGTWSDMEPAMSPDGRFLVFVSNRPAEAGGTAIDGAFLGRQFPGGGGNLWRVDRQGAGWSRPVRLPDTINQDNSIFAPAVAADGSLYFMRPAANPKRFQIFRSQSANGGYGSPEALPFSNGSSNDVDPAVAPDESFVVFGSGRPPAQGMDLFIVFRKAGAWGTPIHLGDVVNSPGSDAESRLGPDRRTLYFSSERQQGGDPAPAWDNGKYNLWTVSLAPWIDAALGKKDVAPKPAPAKPAKPAKKPRR